MYIAYNPQIPMLERTLHVMVAMLLVFLWLPRQRWLDALLLAVAAASTVYYALNFRYLTERMENVDPVLPLDQVFGLLTLILLLEAVRRVLGWNLFAVVMVFIVYGFTAHWMPGWLHFHGFEHHGPGRRTFRRCCIHLSGFRLGGFGHRGCG